MPKEYKEDALGTRMKQYEAVPKTTLTLGIPKAIRLDMRAGHTFCRSFARPFDPVFSGAIDAAAKRLCEEIPGVMCAFTQSDEISLIINDITERGHVVCFFDGQVEKIVSTVSSKCTLAFQKAYQELSIESGDPDGIYRKNFWEGEFDARVWCLPNVEEVHNYLLWRQLDTTRNSIQMVAHAVYSDEECKDKKLADLQDMLISKGINWNDYSVRYKRGGFIVREQYMKDVDLPDGRHITGVIRKRWTDMEVPIFSKDISFVPNVFKRGMLIDGQILSPVMREIYWEQERVIREIRRTGSDEEIGWLDAFCDRLSDEHMDVHSIYGYAFDLMLGSSPGGAAFERLWKDTEKELKERGKKNGKYSSNH